MKNTFGFRNGVKESPIVTEMFNIRVIPSDHVQSEEYENRILQELQLERQVNSEISPSEIELFS